MYKRKLLERNSIYSSLIASIKTTLFEKSHETQEHADRLINLTSLLGRAIALSDTQLNELELLSTLHDVGKISIPDSILSKREALPLKNGQR
jgi:response regulator RpfG family c-di-GMP phosphodiesterase